MIQSMLRWGNANNHERHKRHEKKNSEFGPTVLRELLFVVLVFFVVPKYCITTKLTKCTKIDFDDPTDVAMVDSLS